MENKKCVSVRMSDGYYFSGNATYVASKIIHDYDICKKVVLKGSAVHVLNQIVVKCDIIERISYKGYIRPELR